MDAFKKRNDLLPEFHDEPGGVQMATFVLTPEKISECDSAEKEERKAFTKYKDTLGKILEVNTKLRP